jgi:hypothetical protein
VPLEFISSGGNVKTRVRTLTLLVSLGCGALAAQDNMKPANVDEGKPPQSAAMQMPAPAPEMTRLIKALSGAWTVTEKQDPNPMNPKGSTGKGTAVLTPGPGNLSLIEKYHSVGTMGGINGLGVFWWDAKKQVYRSLWCDNGSPNGCDASGTTKWEGNDLVGTTESEMNGQTTMMRFTYSDWKPNSFVMTMEMGPNASSMNKFMTITYSKGGAMAAKAEKPAQ